MYEKKDPHRKSDAGNDIFHQFPDHGRGYAGAGRRRSLALYFQSFTLYRLGLLARPQGHAGRPRPHAPLHKVFVNKQALESTSAPLKFGAIEVKENYSPSHELKAITVMYKIKGYNPKDGDWFWVKYSASGKTLKSGKPGGCIGCHATRVANDYVLVHEFK